MKKLRKEDEKKREEKKQELLEAVLSILPFRLLKVETIEENAGTVWVVLDDGQVFALTIIGCEGEQQ